ncbi:MAG: NAD-dependent DNA ligase LigA [Tissierellia bacterium]|nr:NAD-dependent DNA ligase LigA [Tissierellia bacterium]
MQEWVDILNRWSKSYYTLDEPEVSDKEYDELYDKLRALEQETGVVLPDSPTQRVGGEILDHFEKHHHLAPLYSLDKAQSYEQLEEWVRRNERLLENAKDSLKEPLPDLEYVVEYKFDGLTINLTYEDGYLKTAATRGNGKIGEEILEQIRRIPSVPLKIPSKNKMEIQGEGLMPLSKLEEYNKTAKEPLKNARNAAAGALRNLDPNVVKERSLTAYFYNIGYIEGKEFATDMEMKEFLRENQFLVHPSITKVKSVKEAEKEIERIGKLRGDLDILIDGVVIKINDMKIREVLGFTNKFPRWAIAYKFEAEETSTILEDVVWNVGRTGKLTPTAILSPVEIGGVTIRRATLNNYDDIERKEVEIGARVLIRRSNDVIPEIMGVLPSEEKTKEIKKPDRCPACGAKIIQDGVHIFCPNTLSCQPQLVARLTHFASRDAMNIEGFSEKTILKLLQEKDLREIPDIYQLTFDDFRSMEGFKDKRSQNMIDAIEASKNPNLSNFIYALGIHNVGAKTAEDLAHYYKTFEAFVNSSYEELINIGDIGPVTGEEIRKFFDDPEIQESLKHLKELGVFPKEEIIEEKGSQLANKTIVLTGALTVSRKEMEELLKSYGAKITGSVSKNTDIVLVGEKPGSKKDKAEELGIDILNENEIRKLISKEE